MVSGRLLVVAEHWCFTLFAGAISQPRHLPGQIAVILPWQMSHKCPVGMLIEILHPSYCMSHNSIHCVLSEEKAAAAAEEGTEMLGEYV